MNNHSILDVGCGFGDLFGYLKKNKTDFDYLGCDINEKIINVAKDQYPDVTFVVHDFLDLKLEKKYDWVIASGIFNFKLNDNEIYIQKMLTKMFQSCKIGFRAASTASSRLTGVE